MEVLPCGTEVILKRSEYKGIVVGINIRDTRIIYEISYYENGAYKTNWFCDYEFIVESTVQKLELGFKE